LGFRGLSRGLSRRLVPWRVLKSRGLDAPSLAIMLLALVGARARLLALVLARGAKPPIQVAASRAVTSQEFALRIQL
jgi:hypothetical protein